MAVGSDREAERIAGDFHARGYAYEATLEHRDTGRLATVRLLAPGERPGGVIVDLLFASSGVESEVVEAADLLDLLPGFAVPVATVGHLLALKVLAARPKDLSDIETLLTVAGPTDIEEARNTLRLIIERGYGRDKNLMGSFAQILARHPGGF